MSQKVTSSKTALLISPIAGIWRHTILEMSLAATLRRQDFQVLVLSCDGQNINRCSFIDLMESKKGSISKLDSCRECKCRHIARKERMTNVGVQFLNISPHTNVDKWLSECRNKTPDMILWRGIEVGRFATYELALNMKCDPSMVPILEPLKYLEYIQTTTKIMEEVRTLCTQRRVDVVIFGNGLTALNRSAWEWCKKENLPTIDIMNVSHKGYRNRKYYASSNLWPPFYPNKERMWDTVKEIALNSNENIFVDTYLDSEIFEGGVKGYGLGGEQVETVSKGQSSRKRILCVFNSPDERKTASYVLINPDKYIETVEEQITVILQIAKVMKNVHFVLRLHPRMGGEVHGDESPELDLLRIRLISTPNNVEIEWPQARKSLKSSLQSANLVISFGSTAGLVASAIGKPVILASEEYDWNFPRDIYHLPLKFTTSSLIDKIETILAESGNANETDLKTLYARRTINFIHNILSLDYQFSELSMRELPRSTKLASTKRLLIAFFKQDNFQLRQFAENIKFFRILIHSLRNLNFLSDNQRSEYVWRQLSLNKFSNIEDLLLESYLRFR